MNAVIFQVSPVLDAFWPSAYRPWSDRILTANQPQGTSPGFDPLAIMVEETHKRGLEFHAWFNPYRVYQSGYTDSTVTGITADELDAMSNTDAVNALLAQFRSTNALSANNYAVLNPDKVYRYLKTGADQNRRLFLDAGYPEVRQHVVDTITEVIQNYDVDAIHFDDYFYPYKVADENKKIVDFPDSKSFEKYGKTDGYTQETRDDWRRNNVNVLIKALNETIKGIKPWVKFGISPFGIWRNIKNDPTGSDTDAGVQNYDDLYADIKLWVEKRWIDYNVPQLYFDIGHPKADYQILIDWWSENNFGENLYIGQAINQTVRVKSRKKEGEYENQLPRKMETTRNNKNVHGNVWWSGYEMKRNRDGFINQLKSYHQTRIALMPKYKNIDTIAPEPLRELKIEKQNADNYLVWTATPTNDLMQKAAYYCIYKVEKAGDDINKKSPDAITQNAKFKVSKSGVYAVTVLDKLQNESVPKYIEVK